MHVNQSYLEKVSRELLEQRGVQIKDIAEIVYFLQSKYMEDLTIETCIENVNQVITKREVQHAILTGIQLDMLAEEKGLIDPIQDIISRDEGLYGIDEIIALSIVNVYGSIGFTSYGYVDKLKAGILEELNEHKDGTVNTFLDDIDEDIASAASSRLAHSTAGDKFLDS